MKLLDLFCGAGGAAMGYHRAGFEVVGVDNRPQPHYPFEFVLGDAIDVLHRMLAGEKFLASDGKWYGIEDFDAIHASPPCQAYSGMRRITIARYGAAPEHPDLIDATRSVLEATGRIWVMENVQNSPLRTQIILCGAAMGLSGIARHRHFESSILLPAPPRCAHLRQPQTIGVYGQRPDGRRVSYRHHRLVRIANSLIEAQKLMGIDWMDWSEITQSVPPVYTEWIGNRLLEYN